MRDFVRHHMFFFTLRILCTVVITADILERITPPDALTEFAALTPPAALTDFADDITADFNALQQEFPAKARQAPRLFQLRQKATKDIQRGSSGECSREEAMEVHVEEGC